MGGDRHPGIAKPRRYVVHSDYDTVRVVGEEVRDAHESVIPAKAGMTMGIVAMTSVSGDDDDAVAFYWRPARLGQICCSVMRGSVAT
jgi:hypothetical protein